MSRRKHVKRGQRYGLVADPHNPPLANAKDYGPIAYNAEWIYHSVPSDSQGDLGACVGYAWANWMEAMLRKHLGRDVLSPGEQIDGEAIWREGRRRFYPREREEDGGLLLEHGFEAALSMGILPKGSTLVRLRRNDPVALASAIRGNPLVIAQALHEHWNFPRKDNGFILRAKGDRFSGHAIVLSGITKQRGQPFYVITNSWGTTWGWHGLCLLSESHYRLNTLAMPAYAVLPDGWTAHEGWRRWVKMRPETAG
jgi:hypothetical protein